MIDEQRIKRWEERQNKREKMLKLWALLLGVFAGTLFGWIGIIGMYDFGITNIERTRYEAMIADKEAQILIIADMCDRTNPQPLED